MKAGFAKVSITPPLGTYMMGFGRDREHGCTGIHDDIFVRATYVEDGDERALIMGFDICFLGREESDRYRGAIGRRIDLLPRQILLNTSHNHAGTAVGPWCYGDFRAPDKLYLQDLEDAILKAAVAAFENAREVTLWAGATRSKVPMNRRRNEDGKIVLGPNPDGLTCDTLPILLLKDSDDRPVSLMFSISCHPAIVSGWEISADFPGVAMQQLADYLGVEASQFLQGAGGDAMPCVQHTGGPRWAAGTWDMMNQAGTMLAAEVRETVEGGLEQVEPRLNSASVETAWPLQEAPQRFEFEAIAEQGTADWKHLWALKQLRRLDRGETLATHAPITVQGIQLGKGLRVIAVEGELLAPHGIRIVGSYGDGVTFPLGYSNGTGLYLVASDMVDEGGEEVTTYAEYGFPAPLAKGMEAVLDEALEQLRAKGVE